MRALLLAVMVLFVASAASARRKAKEPAVDAATDSVNRALAVVIANSLDPILTNISNNGVPVMRSEVGRYIAEILDGKEPGMSLDEAKAHVDSVLQSKIRHIPDTVPTEPERAFVARAAAREGAVTTPSGLVFEVIVEGEGVHPAANDTVTASYQGRFSDGTLFDDTGAEKITFVTGNELPGIDEALRMMKPGGTYRITIPSELAYGERGIPGIIPGNAALEFVITVDSVTPSSVKP